MTSLTKEACAPLGVKPRDAERSKNFFALGLVSWMYTRPVEPTLDWIERAVRQEPAGRATPTRPRSRPATPSARPPSCSTTRTRSSRRRSTPGTYTNITGNTALAWGLVAAGQLAELPLFLGSLPDHAGVRHPPRAVEAQELRRAHAAGRGRDRRHRRRPRRGVRRPPRRHHHQRSRASRSRPRRSAWPSASSCRCSSSTSSAAGPSTGLPTKTEAGRPAAWPCTAATASRRCRSSPRYSPSHCFDAAIEAARIALKYRTPVILLSDGYLANGSEPWRLPDVDDAARHLASTFATEPNHIDADGNAGVLALPPRSRHAGPAVGRARHARADAPHRRHREGGRHRQHLLRPRQPRAHGRTCGPPRSPASPTTSRRVEVDGDVDDAELLVLGWGSTWGAIGGAVDRVRGRGPQGRPGPPRAPQPVPRQPRRGAAPLPARCSCPR